jgi:hypothetical protein
MQRRPIAARKVIRAMLILQVIPLLLFPPESFAPNSQEWWLPILLAGMVVTADLEVLVRGSRTLWPWHLMIFAQGFNIISRIMMMWAHATTISGGVTVLNLPYLALTLVAMTWSAFLLWYLELPDVRLGTAHD